MRFITLSKGFSLALIFISLSYIPKSFGFVTMVRHGYTTCLTCHFNTSGGGVLRAYGKIVAGETLGVFNTSESALPWLKEPAERERFFIAFMGRSAQTLFDSPQVKRGDFKKMQADLEIAYSRKKYVATLTVGPRLDSATESIQEETDLFVRRFYLGKQSMRYSVKAGMFFPEFGLNVPNHNLPTRKGLYFNHNQETWTAQGSYFTQTYDVTLSYLVGAKESQLEDFTGFSGTYAYKLGAMRAGISNIYFSHNDDVRKSAATSVFATFGYYGLGYTLVEVAKKSVFNTLSRPNDTMQGFAETGWEFYKGFVPYLIYEFTKDETRDNLNYAYGMGIQLGPITHFDIVAQATKTVSPSGDGYAMFSMFNLYF